VRRSPEKIRPPRRRPPKEEEDDRFIHVPYHEKKDHIERSDHNPKGRRKWWKDKW
jgi:hypothetical protein